MRTCNFFPLGRVARAVRRAWRMLLAIRGRFACPACGRRVRTFIPYPAEYEQKLRAARFWLPWTSSAWETFHREAYTCPFCDATDRERLYALYLRERLPPPPAPRPRILDLGPTRPLTAFLGRQNADHRTADLNNPEADDRVDITDMGRYPDGSFDVLICSHVLEHVEDDRRAIAELHRALRPGGWGLVMVPVPTGLDATYELPSAVTPEERWHHFGEGCHVRIYTSADFTRRLQNGGFHVKKLGGEYFGKATLARHGITPQSALYVVEKPG